MKLTIESTDEFIEFNNTKCRVWKGKTEGGNDIVCLIAGVGVPENADAAELGRELTDLHVITPIVVETSDG